jgi:hypothetical protein
MSASSARYVWDEESVGPGPRQLNEGGGHAILLAAALADLLGRGQVWRICRKSGKPSGPPAVKCRSTRRGGDGAFDDPRAAQPQDRQGARPHHPPSLLARADQGIE